MGKRRADRWPELKRLVAEDDGLPVRTIGSWTEDKLWWWNRYLEITTGALVGRPKWPARLAYVDLFAGPGVLELRGSRARVPGSPLLAANTPKPFDRLIFCEEQTGLAEACRARLSGSNVARRCEVLVGDCNQLIDEICSRIPAQSLTLAFVDPTGLHAYFQTLGTLTTGRAVDLLILFADHMDIIRNVELYAGQQTSKLDRVLGPGSNWRKRWRELANPTADKTSKLFVEIYKEQLQRHLQYSVFGDEVLRRPSGGSLYRVLYASRHRLGLDFWRESTRGIRGGGRFSFD